MSQRERERLKAEEAAWGELITAATTLVELENRR